MVSRFRVGARGAIFSLLIAGLFLLALFGGRELLAEPFVALLDVGQGDAIYIRLKDDFDILIDGGPDDRLLSELGRVMPSGDREISLLVISHPHLDHIAGLLSLIDNFTIRKIWLTGALHPAESYTKLLEKIKKAAIPTEFVARGKNLELDRSEKFQVLWPETDLAGARIDNPNNGSIVNKLTVNGECSLYSGDAEVEVLERLVFLAVDNELNCQILKIGHHGSRNGLTESFLKAVSPKTGLISVGQDNQFGHPHKETLELLKAHLVDLFRTDQEGTILFELGSKNPRTKILGR